MQTIPHVSSKRNAEAISFRGCWQAPSYCCASSFFKISVSTPVYKLLAQSRKLLVKNLSVCLFFFYSRHKDIKRLSEVGLQTQIRVFRF